MAQKEQETDSKSLTNEEIGRYGRQLILPEWGVEGQLALRSTSVLIVGVGGLGCPSALYLAAAGIGHLGLLDYDSVELSNLHRQILHTEQRVGVPKSDSAKQFLTSLNSAVKCTPHNVLLNSENALEILSQYDVVVDCTDNVATRYLLNDACVLLKKPLVSGSALRFEGQLTVYNYCGGPCYRCLFPSPPPPHTVTNCSDGGVVGAVPGMIGTLQALEVMKIATKIGSVCSQKMLMFDGLMCTFRTIKLRPRQSQCAVCGDNPPITKLIDYQLFCGSKANDKSCSVDVLKPEERVSCSQYQELVDSGAPHLLLDVREPVQFNICHLSHATNIPLSSMESSRDGAASSGIQRVDVLLKDFTSESQHSGAVPVYVICRLGNDSQRAVQLLSGLSENSVAMEIKDIVGGLTEWSNTVDPTFPKY